MEMRLGRNYRLSLENKMVYISAVELLPMNVLFRWITVNIGDRFEAKMHVRTPKKNKGFRNVASHVPSSTCIIPEMAQNKTPVQ